MNQLGNVLARDRRFVKVGFDENTDIGGFRMRGVRLGTCNCLREKEQVSTPSGCDMANKLVASIELMRVKNLGLALIATPLGAAFALLEFSTLTDYPEIGLATLSVLFFMAAGNALNDLSDIEIDKSAHPSRPLYSRFT